MRSAYILILLIFSFSCKEKSTGRDVSSPNTEDRVSERREKDSLKSYSNDSWVFSIRYPEEFQILESELPGEAPVINIFPSNSSYNPPFAIHEAPDLAYLAVIPEGFGVDAPSGKQKTIEEWNENPEIDPELNKEESKVYMLESGEPWAFYLRFQDPPADWTEYGGMFVQFKINNFKAECFDKEGEKKEMRSCDPMGSDEVRYTGEIDRSSKEKILRILKSFKFETTGKINISELIQVEKPLPNIEVTSPLTVKGSARGFWYFEANAPIEILDKDYKKLGESYIKAEGEWMTRDFVDFTGTIEFNAPDDERGYLVFRRANPSDKRENDREYCLPVIFPPKQ